MLSLQPSQIKHITADYSMWYNCVPAISLSACNSNFGRIETGLSES